MTKNIKKQIFFMTFIGTLFLLNLSFSLSQDDGSISGTIISGSKNVKVQAVQDLKLISETNPNDDGRYILSGLAEGTYGLLIEDGGKIYIYNDAMSRYWFTDSTVEITQIEFIYVAAGEQLSGYNFNLNEEKPDYFDRRLTIKMVPSASETEIEDLIESYGSEVIKKREVSSGDTWYTISVPEGKTVLELVIAFDSEDIVEQSSPDMIAFGTNDKEEIIEENGVNYDSEILEELIYNNKQMKTSFLNPNNWFWLILTIVFGVILMIFLKKRRISTGD